MTYFPWLLAAKAKVEMIETGFVKLFLASVTMAANAVSSSSSQGKGRQVGR